MRFDSLLAQIDDSYQRCGIDVHRVGNFKDLPQTRTDQAMFQLTDLGNIAVQLLGERHLVRSGGERDIRSRSGRNWALGFIFPFLERLLFPKRF